MRIEFKKFSEYQKGLIFNLLSEAYSYDMQNEKAFSHQWKKFDDFFFNNLNIADKYGFVTTINNKPIGFSSWDPRNKPDFVEVGHNCIVCKGKGFGNLQMQETVRRIKLLDTNKIIVTTNANFLPAIKMYEKAGFKLIRKRKNLETPFTGDYLDFEIIND